MTRGDGLFDLCLHGFEVEARALLRGRKVDRRLAELRRFLLHEHATPEFVHVPVDVRDRAGLRVHRQAGALVRVEPEVGHDRPIDLDRVAEPPRRLIGEPILEVADARGSERGFREVPDLVALRRSLAGDEVCLVVAVEVLLVRPVADLLALLELVDDVGIAGRRDEGREPVESGDDRVLHLARRDCAGPTDDHRSAEAALEPGSLAAGERRLTAIGPGEVLGAVVGRKGDDRVVLERRCPSGTS